MDGRQLRIVAACIGGGNFDAVTIFGAVDDAFRQCKAECKGFQVLRGAHHHCVRYAVEDEGYGNLGRNRVHARCAERRRKHGGRQVQDGSGQGGFHRHDFEAKRHSARIPEAGIAIASIAVGACCKKQTPLEAGLVGEGEALR